MKRRLIVISVDALTDDDIRRAKDLPNLSCIIGNGIYIPNINGIYPSLTHPCHTSIITGRRPGYHGVISNEDFSKPGRPWFNSLSDIQTPTVIDYFKRSGLSVACCRWPVTAGGFDKIDYLVPEIPDGKLIEDDCEGYYKKVSSPVLFNAVIKPNLPRLKGKSQPEEDLFSTACVCDIIRQFKPDVLFTHPASVDTFKHLTGIMSRETLDAIELADRLVGEIIQATRDAGVFDQTVFIVLSDHGHMEVDRELALNEVFKRDGLLRTDGRGKVISARLIADECGHSAQIYLNGMSEDEAVRYLSDKEAVQDIGVGRVFTSQELRERYGTFGDFSLMVEGDGHTQFSNAVDCEIETCLTVDDHHGRSTHGHMPEKSPKPVFMAAGPGIGKGLVMEAGMLQEAATFLKVFGIAAPDLEPPLDIFCF